MLREQKEGGGPLQGRGKPSSIPDQIGITVRKFSVVPGTQFMVKIDYSLSKMLGTVSVSDFRVFWILEYLHTLYWLSIPKANI